MKPKYYFVLQRKYGDVYDVFNFDTRDEMNSWKEGQKKMFGDDVEFIYTSYVPETWDTYELKSSEWGI